MLFKVIVVLVAISAASAVRVNIRQCPGGWHMPEWFESNDCTADRCTLRRNQVFTGRAMVIPKENFSTLLVGIQASLFGINFPMPIPPGYENACDFLEAGATCPVFAGRSYVWSLQTPVDGTMPAAQGVIIRRKHQLYFFARILFSISFCFLVLVWAGEQGRRVACAEITGDVV